MIITTPKRWLIYTIASSLILFVYQGEGRKSKKIPTIPNYQIYQGDELLSDVQITTQLYKNVRKRFFYTSKFNNTSLSATLTTCTSSIKWTFYHSSLPSLSSSSDNTSNRLFDSMDTIHLYHTSIGTYILDVTPIDNNTLLHIYVSTEKGGPQALENAKNQQIKLVHRQKRKKLTVRWDPSLVDPQGTDYCLVITTKRYYSSFCTAQMEKFGPYLNHNTTTTATTNQEPQIVCVSRKTHHTISNLKQGQHYFFSLFAINRQSNFTYPYSTSYSTFDNRIKPASLRDAKITVANLKKLDGKAVYRYKVGKNAANTLELFVMPCGGAVDVEILHKEKMIVGPKRIEGFGKLSIDNPIKMGRYYIKIFATNKEELKKTSGVEIYITTRNSPKIPLPNMPQEVTVKEYSSLRRCDSVTVGWLAAAPSSAPPSSSTHHQPPLQYCLVVREGKIHEMEDFKMPNQCGLENRLRKSVDFTMEYCMTIKQDKEQVITRKINQLKPDRNYIVQVTVKKPKGKTLSYDLLQVHTKPSCHKKSL